MQPWIPCLEATGALLLAALGRYAWLERRHRARWYTIPDGALAADGAGGVYRGGGTVPRYLGRAPLLVRFAAWTSFFVAGLFVPLTVAALALGDFMMLMMLGPALLASGALRRAGRALLARETRRSWFLALAAVRSIGWAHGFTLAFVLAATVTPLRQQVELADGARVALALMAVISIAEVLFVRAVAERYQDALFAA